MQAVIRLYREARRRKVFRVAALYVVGAWLSLQIADVLFPGFGIPNSAIQVLLWAAVAGFPVAMAFGWLFEVGPGGIRRTGTAAAGEAAPPQPLARRDYLILAAFAAIAAVLAYRAAQEVRETPKDAAMSHADAATGADMERLENSIAVLPFANISDDPANEYFCDGISEEILNALSGFRELNVIGRTSSFAFKGSDVGIVQISAVLGVRHVLQGSVRKAGNQLRISAQLLDEAGRQIWTETFDRELANVFDIQAEIAKAVATTVASQVTSRADAGHHPDLDAYDHYLAGRALLHGRDWERALTELQRAIEIDPEFAEAHAELAIGHLISFASAEDLLEARKAIERALALRPKLLRAQVAQAGWLMNKAPTDPRAETILRGVLAQDPNMSDALLWLANALDAQGRMDEVLTVLQRAVRIDPLHPSIVSNLADVLLRRGDQEQADRLIERLLTQPHPPIGSYRVARDYYWRRGRLVDLTFISKQQVLLFDRSRFALAVSYGLLGDFPAAEYWLERTMRDYPEHPPAPFFLAVVPDWQGRPDEALRRFREALGAKETDLAAQDVSMQAWYGALLARAGQHTAAIQLLESLADPNAPPGATMIPDGPLHDGRHALAWSYLRIGADAKASALLADLWRRCQVDDAGGSSRDSYLLGSCAETALFRGDTDGALALLERAIAAGWRDYYLREHDPYWAALAGNARYRKLMAKVKTDVDRQRAEVVAIDAREDFVAKLDAAMAARAHAEP